MVTGDEGDKIRPLTLHVEEEVLGAVHRTRPVLGSAGVDAVVGGGDVDQLQAAAIVQDLDTIRVEQPATRATSSVITGRLLRMSINLFTMNLLNTHYHTPYTMLSTSLFHCTTRFHLFVLRGFF